MQVVGNAWKFGPNGREAIPFLSEELDMTKSFTQIADTVLGITAVQEANNFYERRIAILFPRKGRDKPMERLATLADVGEVISRKNNESIRQGGSLPPMRYLLTAFYRPHITGTNGEIARLIALYQTLGVRCDLKEISRVNDHYVYEFDTEAK